MRLIDADTLKPSYAVAYSTTDNRWHMYVNIETINSAPTIDAVKVIRCKDCDRSYFDENGWLMCSFWQITNGMDGCVNDEDFCSYGIKEETD